MNESFLKELKDNFNIIFNHTAYLEEAFTHSSYVNEHRNHNLKDNERIEFLGDAVLELI
ncbi:MAG: ribonuclease III, partial [Carnobacterium sp.]